MAQDSLLDRYLTPTFTQGVVGEDPFEEELREQARRSAVLRAQQTGNPDQAGEANRLARINGAPAGTVERNLPLFQERDRARRWGQTLNDHPELSPWLNDGRHASVASDDADALAKIAATYKSVWGAPDPFTRKAIREATRNQAGFADEGFLSTGLSLVRRGFAGLGQGLDAVGAALNKWSAEHPLPWTSDESIREEREQARQLRFRSHILGTTAATPIAGETTWADVKSNPSARTVLGFGLSAGVESLPGMGMAAVALPGYVASQAGSIGTQRAQANGRRDASLVDITEAAPAAIVSAILERIGIERIFGAEAKSVLGRVGKAAAAEGATEAAQSGVEYAGGSVGTDEGFDTGQALDQMLAGLIGGGITGGGLRTGGEVVAPAARRLIRPIAKAAQASRDADALDAMADAVNASKTKGRDPEALASLISLIGGEGAQNVYIPGEAVRSYLQTDDGYDRAFWDGYSDQIAESAATGGDVIIPISEALAHLSGTPAWDSLREDMRLTPDGLSLREASDVEGGLAETTKAVSEEGARVADAAQREVTARQQIEDRVYAMLTNAGMTPDEARTNAALVVQREATRAARFGRELTGQEYSTEVRAVLPAALAPLAQGDSLDLVINAMRQSREGKQDRGPSLLEWIAKQGGVEDRGGDIASMGGAEWHRQAPFRRKLIRAVALDQPSMLGDDGQQNTNSPDEFALRAWEAGYFPDTGERPDVATFLDAVGAELRGEPRYAGVQEDSETARVREAAGELERLLENEGVDPAKASDDDIRSAVARYQQAVDDGGYVQSYGDGPRGRFTPSDRPLIELFGERNLSTFLHETGHQWLEELRSDATSENAPEQIKADWQTVTEWFAANGHPIGEDGEIPVEAHELWARGVERYALEGKAPTSALRRAFETFKSWLIGIYQVVDNLRSPISDEVRGVMDRLIATDEEITAARDEQNIELAFDREQLGMTEAEYAALQRSAQEAKDEAGEALLYKTMAAIRAQRTKEYRDQREGVREERAAAIAQRPVFRALALFSGRERVGSIDRDAFVEVFGEDATALMPKTVPPILGAGGLLPDAAAELAGFRDGETMVRELMGVEQRRRELRENGDKRSVLASEIDRETDEIMRDRYGDPLGDGTIEREARELIHNDKQGEVIAAQMRALARKRRREGDPVRTATPYQVAKQWAASRVASGKVADVASRSAIAQYQRASKKAGRLAQESMLAGDTDEAFRQMQAQMLNNALVSEASKAADEIDAAVRRLAKVSKRRTAKTIDQEYLERAQALLEAVELRPRSQVSIDRQGQFEAWAREQEASGVDVVVPASFEASLGTTHWTRLTVERLLGLDAAVSQLMHLGRLKQSLIDGQEQREFDAVVQEAVNGAAKLPPKPPSDLMSPDWRDRIKHGIASADAALLKMETVFDWLDSGNSDGVFNRIVFRPIAEAQGRENAMVRDYIGRLTEAMAGVGAKTLREWNTRVRVPELINRATGNPWVLTRGELVAVALNMGNEGNIQRLTDGYGWNVEGVRAALNRVLTQDEWAYVQKVWDTIDELWPEIEALERRINGVAPEKIEATPVETPYGTMRGGYYPAVYDSAKDYRAEQLTAEAEGMFSANYTRATTRASATKERMEKVKRPILLDLGIINRHVTEVIHDITHREPVMQAARFLGNERVMAAVDQSLGREVRQQFRPWLKHVANQWAAERAGNEGIAKWLRKARTNATVVGMGFRVSTMLTQVAGYANSFEVVGERWVAPEIAKFAAQLASAPINGAPEMAKFALERSSELRDRLDTLDRDIQAGIRQLSGRTGALTAAKRFAFHGIGYMDRLVSIPTWTGAYNKAIASGLDEEAAIYAADKAIRVSQGSGAAKDLAAVQRGTGPAGEALKLMTMFYSYMSAMYQRQRTLGRNIGVARMHDFPRLLARALWLLVVPPLMAEILSGRGPEDDESWEGWAFSNMLFNFFGTIPGVRDVVRPAYDRIVGNPSFGYQLSPVQRAGESIVNVGGDVGKVIDGEETTHATKDVLEAAGYTTGLVPGQIASAAQFLVDVGEGEQDPQTVADWYEGLTKGKLSEE